MALTDDLGNVVDQSVYDLWGEPTYVAEGVPRQLRYAGYWYDNGLGWYWLTTRAYDPKIERFLQPGLSQSTGLFSYVYANDDPLDSTDPTGEAPWRNCGPDMIYCGGMPGGEVDQPTNVSAGTPCYYNPDDCAWSPSVGASPANDPGGFASTPEVGTTVGSPSLPAEVCGCDPGGGYAGDPGSGGGLPSGDGDTGPEYPTILPVTDAELSSAVDAFRAGNPSYVDE